jgi:hypothetical protein
MEDTSGKTLYFQKNELPPVTMSEETVALLDHPEASKCYHWMLEARARIHLMQ